MVKLVSYEYRAQQFPGVLSRDETAVLPLSIALARPVSDLLHFIRIHTPAEITRLANRPVVTGEGWLPVATLKLLAPIQRPIHDILCVGTNYRDHLAEVQRGVSPEMKAPERTVYFSKRALHLLGSGAAVESHRSEDACLDYEVELAVIIGKSGRNIPPERVAEHIFGYSVFNDLSARTLQREHGQWFRGKSLDGLSAMGPAIVHRSSLPFPPELEIRSLVNGELRQKSNTREMIADLSAVVSTLSQGMTLEAGDIIATGTPSGVGMGFDPPRYLRPGDVVECEIESIGCLQNTIRE